MVHLHGDLSSRYAAIARELAGLVSRGALAEGRRFSCRQLAGQFQVSAETVRRAVTLLDEQGIVRLTKGSGAWVVSQRRATAYLEELALSTKARELRTELAALLRRRDSLEQTIAVLSMQLLEVEEQQDVSGKQGGKHGHV